MDRSLIKKIKNGDKDSFSRLYDELADEALRVAMAITKEKMNAADAVQETFIRVYNNIEKYDVKKPFKPWFYRILYNECNRILKKNSKIIQLSEASQNTTEVSSKDDYNFEEYENLYQAIENLDDINRIPIVLKYFKGFSENEIAQILDININTTKSRLYKGRQKSKKFLQLFEGGNENHG